MAQPEKNRADGGGDALAGLRERIDAVDREILQRLNQRAELVVEVGRLKKASGTAVYEASRERRIVDGLRATNAGPFPDEGLAPVFREIISATRSLEEPTRVAYLGPEGTFSHEAARAQFGALARLVSAPTIVEVFAEVESGRQPLGIVPVENTTEGVVTQTYDALAEFDVPVCGEAVLRISETLMSRSGRREDIRRVASHPQPIAQCRRWLDREVPDVPRIETASTAAAARLAAEDASVAAIGSAAAVEVYDLVAIQSGIEDRRDNHTRFLVIGGEGPPPTGNDLTCVLFTIRRDQPGGLHRLIEPMAAAGVNLTSIQLRPIKGKPWEYLFFIDLEGHRTDAPVASALAEAAAVAHTTRVLGSFPRAEVDRDVTRKDGTRTGRAPT